MPITVAQLCEAAVPIFDVSRRDMIGPSRLKNIFRARAAVCWTAAKAGRSLTDIGKALGDRRAPTIWSAVRSADQFAAEDRVFKLALETLLVVAEVWASEHAQAQMSLHQVRTIKAQARAKTAHAWAEGGLIAA